MNNAAFAEGDAAALRILTEQYDVRFLLIDRLNHNANLALVALGKVVLHNQDATILPVS